MLLYGQEFECFRRPFACHSATGPLISETSTNEVTSADTSVQADRFDACLRTVGDVHLARSICTIATTTWMSGYSKISGSCQFNPPRGGCGFQVAVFSDALCKRCVVLYSLFPNLRDEGGTIYAQDQVSMRFF